MKRWTDSMDAAQDRASTIDPPKGLVPPKSVFVPFWAPYPVLGQGAVNGLPAM
jgi:hypothetical protein